MELCFAKFAKCIKNAMQPPNGDVDVVTLLLEWITDRPEVTDKKGEPIMLNAPLISDLLNRKVDVPKSIREACTTKAILDDAKKHCEHVILPSLIPVLEDDMFDKMINAVENDATVSEKTREKLLALYDNEEYAEFLGWLLIYVINRENKQSNTPIESNDISLLAETGYECPICHAPLIKCLKNIPIKKYEVIEIYPNDISGCEKDFAKIPSPRRRNSLENKIILCSDHAEEYTAKPTVEEYFHLRAIKDRLAITSSLRSDINALVLEDEIQGVLFGLAGITDETVLEELPLEALRLDQKILPENYLLKNDEMTRVLRYYNFISDKFSEMERDNTGDFELIASEIKIAYKKLDKGCLSQDEIVDALAKWIKEKSGVSDQSLRACHIVVAYFIQNCEVFHEISK